MTCPYSALFVPSLISSSLEIYREAVVTQWLSCVQLFATPWTAAFQASLCFTISQSLLKLMSIESVMPSNHLILCHPLPLWPSVFPSIRVFSNELPLCIRWPKYWSFSFSFSPYNKYSGYWSGIHSKSPCWNLSDVFLMIKLELCVLGEEDQSNKVAFFLSYPSTSTYYQHNLLLLMLTLIIQLQWYVSGFSKTTPHPFTLGRKPWSYSQWWKLHLTSLKAEFLCKLLGIFLQWKFVSSSYLFIDLLISVWTHGCLCHTLGYNSNSVLFIL